MAVAEIIKGFFKFAVAADALTITAMGVTKVRFPKAATPGDFVTLDLTGKSYSVDFNAYPVNAGCGLTVTVNWANAMPWFVYLGNEDDTAANVFAFNTRDPRMPVTPAVGLINDTDAVGATAQSQNHINSFKADDAGIAAKPCIRLGSHTMTWDTADDRWTLVALTTADGFGMFQEGVAFTFPAGQNGNMSGKHFTVSDGNTALAFSTNTAVYWVNRDGTIVYRTSITGRTANGADGVLLRFYPPYLNETASTLPPLAGSGILTANNIVYTYLMYISLYGVLRYHSTAAIVNDNIFANANDQINTDITYQVF